MATVRAGTAEFLEREFDAAVERGESGVRVPSDPGSGGVLRWREMPSNPAAVALNLADARAMSSYRGEMVLSDVGLEDPGELPGWVQDAGVTYADPNPTVVRTRTGGAVHYTQAAVYWHGRDFFLVLRTRPPE